MPEQILTTKFLMALETELRAADSRLSKLMQLTSDVGISVEDKAYGKFSIIQRYIKGSLAMVGEAQAEVRAFLAQAAQAYPQEDDGDLAL